MNNVTASRLGSALQAAAGKSYGDLIDRGWALKNELEYRGYQIVPMEDAPVFREKAGKPV